MLKDSSKSIVVFEFQLQIKVFNDSLEHHTFSNTRRATISK